MVIQLEIKKLPDEEYSVHGREGTLDDIYFTGSDIGAVENILELGHKEGKKFKIEMTGLTKSLIGRYGNRDIQNLHQDLHDEHTAAFNYSKHILETKNPVVKKKLQEIRGEEEHHIDELNELLDG
jgi:gentisate 1,2-dioxygenase